MSDLTIGKIVNNSATLVLNSTDQDGFGEKIVTNDNFIPIHAPGGGADKNYPDPVYKVINDDFGENGRELYTGLFQYLDLGPVAGLDEVTGDNFVVDKYYIIKTIGAGNNGTFLANAATADPILSFSGAAQYNAEPGAGLYYKCIRQSGAANFEGVGCEVKLTPVGTRFTTAVAKADQSTTFAGTATALGTAEYNNIEYPITIPNETSFPGKTRCMCQVQSISHYNIGDTLCYVDIPEMAPQSIFMQNRRAVGFLPSVWTSQNNGTLLDTGTMCQNPFGKRLTVRLMDAHTNELMGTNIDHVSRATPTIDIVKKNATTVVLRLLFLDNNDLKDY